MGNAAPSPLPGDIVSPAAWTELFTSLNLPAGAPGAIDAEWLEARHDVVEVQMTALGTTLEAPPAMLALANVSENYEQATFALGQLFTTLPVEASRLASAESAIASLGRAVLHGWKVHHSVAKFAANALTILCLCDEADAAARKCAAAAMLAGMLHWLRGARTRPGAAAAVETGDVESICGCSCASARGAATCWLERLFKTRRTWLDEMLLESKNEIMRPLVLELVIGLREENSNPFALAYILQIPTLISQLIRSDPMRDAPLPCVSEAAVASARAYSAAIIAVDIAAFAAKGAIAAVDEAEKLVAIALEGTTDYVAESRALLHEIDAMDHSIEIVSTVSLTPAPGSSLSEEEHYYDAESHDGLSSDDGEEEEGEGLDIPTRNELAAAEVDGFPILGPPVTTPVDPMAMTSVAQMLAGLAAFMPAESSLHPELDCGGSSAASFGDMLTATLTYAMMTVEDVFFTDQAVRSLAAVAQTWSELAAEESGDDVHAGVRVPWLRSPRGVVGAPPLGIPLAEEEGGGGDDKVDVSSLSVRELKKRLSELGVDTSGCVDRSDLDNLGRVTLEQLCGAPPPETRAAGVRRLLQNPASVLMLESVAFAACTLPSAAQFLRVLMRDECGHRCVMSMLHRQVVLSSLVAKKKPAEDSTKSSDTVSSVFDPVALPSETEILALGTETLATLPLASPAAAADAATKSTKQLQRFPAEGEEVASTPTAATRIPDRWPYHDDYFLTWNEFRLKMWSDIRGTTAMNIGEPMVVVDEDAESLPLTDDVRGLERARTVALQQLPTTATTVGLLRQWPLYTQLAKDPSTAWSLLEVADELHGRGEAEDATPSTSVESANLTARHEQCECWRSAVLNCMTADDKRVWLRRRLYAAQQDDIDARLLLNPDEEEPLAFIESDRSSSDNPDPGPGRVFRELFLMYQTQSGLWDDLSGQIEVRFKDEVGTGSAVLREWLVHVSDAMLHPAANLLASRDGRKTFFVSPSAALVDLRTLEHRHQIKKSSTDDPVRVATATKAADDGAGEAEAGAPATAAAATVDGEEVVSSEEDAEGGGDAEEDAFQSASAEEVRRVLFESMGRIVGLALLNQICIGIRFNTTFCRRLLERDDAPWGERNDDDDKTNGSTGWWSIDELSALDADFVKYKFQWIAENSIEEMGLVFDDVLDDRGASEATVKGAEARVPIVEGGEDIDVTDANKHDYLNALAARRLWGTSRVATASLLHGLHSIISTSIMGGLRSIVAPEWNQFSLMIAGLPSLDMDDWQAQTLYVGRYTSETPVVKHFWEVVRSSFSIEERSALLQFATGSRHPPVGGFAKLQGFNGGLHKFSIGPLHGARGEGAVGGESAEQRQSLPQAHSCICTIDIPEWATMEETEEKLRLAVTHGLRFDG